MNQYQQQLSTQALDYILDMPDDLFRTTYPALVEEIKKSAATNEFNGGVENGMSEDERVKVIEEIESLEQMLKDDNITESLCAEKVMFLQLILDISKDKIANIPYRDNVHVSVQLYRKTAQLPTYANSTDAGCDVYAAEDVMIGPGATAIVPTGLKMAVPVGWMISIRPRSGISFKTGLRVANAPGTVDSLYRDEVGVIMHNTSNEAANIRIGDRIAQMVIEKAPMIRFDVVEDINLIKGNRGGGYGST